MKELEFRLLEDNMGAQYHQYLFGILLTNPKNKAFIYNNYMGMLVKHYYDSHVDFVFDGIYACRDNIFRQLIIRGPVERLHYMIKECIDGGAYVIINVNEENLSKRSALHQKYFRHDLLIYGYDKRKKRYRTVGFDEQFHYSVIDYSWEEIELAYGSMKSEWDYEFFAFSLQEDYEAKLDIPHIVKELERYLQGENPVSLQLERFLEGRDESYFVNDSYKNYYGIRVYDYLVERMKGTQKRFLNMSCNDTLGVHDIRSINALWAHIKIIEDMIGEICDDTELSEELQKHRKELYAGKLLFMNYLRCPDRKNEKKTIRHLWELKRKEKEVIGRILEVLQI